MLRRSELCPGTEYCPEVLNVNPFPQEVFGPCDECPLQMLEDYLAGPGGRVIAQTIDLDFALQAGFTVTLADVTYPEFLLLRILGEERQRHQDDERKKAEAQQHRPMLPHWRGYGRK